MTTPMVRASLLAGALALVPTGCAVQKQYRMETGDPRLANLSQTVAVDAAQPKVLLQLTSSGSLEARFEEAPVCRVSETMSTPNYRIEERELSTFDTVLMWSSYGAAAIVGGFVGTGVANGGDPATGAKLFAMFGLPFAAVGAVESYRAMDRTTELEPTEETFDRGLRRCAVDGEGMPVRLRRGVDEKIVMLSTDFRELARPDEGSRFELVGEKAEATVRASVPLQVDGDALVAVLDGPVVVRAIEQAPKEVPVLAQEESKPAVVPASSPVVESSPTVAAAPEKQAPKAPAPPRPSVPAAPAPTVAVAAETEKPHAKRSAPGKSRLTVQQEAGSAAAAPCNVRETRYGPAPSTFYEQPVESYRLQKGDWLSRVARRLWGDAGEYRQLHLLNGERIKNADVVYAGDEIVVPQAPKTWAEWQVEADTCSGEEEGN